ncbi:unnamed protein product [Allacma fusca]|uniref:Uncharacterized protein n=1 Tax=Allacma fusca TaxID=39272 RepID=A0A8J2NUE7_9HEXA|nr:unnamed protein product [Allacma fusca]
MWTIILYLVLAVAIALTIWQLYSRVVREIDDRHRVSLGLYAGQTIVPEEPIYTITVTGVSHHTNGLAATDKELPLPSYEPPPAYGTVVN